MAVTYRKVKRKAARCASRRDNFALCVADVTWSNDNWNVNYGVQYVGKSSRYANDVIAGNPDIAAPEYIYFDPRFIHDFRVEHTIGEEKRFSVYGGVNNFTNELPELGSINAQTGWRGRYFFAGIRLRMDALGFSTQAGSNKRKGGRAICLPFFVSLSWSRGLTPPSAPAPPRLHQPSP